MIQKVLKVGTSAAVTIPKESLKQLGLKIGDRVRVETNPEKRMFAIHPTQNPLSKGDEKIARLTLRFVERYRKDLEALARQ